jgi:hypothetical protein
LELDEQECVNKILQRRRLLSVFEVPQYDYDGKDSTTANEDAMFDDEGILSPTGQMSPRERMLTDAEPSAKPAQSMQQFLVTHEEGKMIVFREIATNGGTSSEISSPRHSRDHAQQLNQQLRATFGLGDSAVETRSSNTSVQ